MIKESLKYIKTSLSGALHCSQARLAINTKGCLCEGVLLAALHRFARGSLRDRVHTAERGGL